MRDGLEMGHCDRVMGDLEHRGGSLLPKEVGGEQGARRLWLRSVRYSFQKWVRPPRSGTFAAEGALRGMNPG